MLKKIVLLLSIYFFISCTDNTKLGNCTQTLPLNLVTDLNNPEMINAQTPGGFALLSGGSKGIVLLNINGNNFVAFDRKCPNENCNSPMTYDKSRYVLKCVCDYSEYGIYAGIGGAPQSDGFQCPAIEYRVTKNGSTIRISNF
jgi:nitrite reductase/ring-hydroxylating ferredoxin subunit